MSAAPAAALSEFVILASSVTTPSKVSTLMLKLGSNFTAGLG